MNKTIPNLIIFLFALYIQNVSAEFFMVDEITKEYAYTKLPISKVDKNQTTLSQSETSQPDIKKQTTLVTVEHSLIKPLPRWTLTTGHTISQELKNWGTQSGWNVIWNLPRDIIVPSTTEFIGEFPTVAADVIKTLAANGALINAKFYEGNKTMVVNGPGVVPQN